MELAPGFKLSEAGPIPEDWEAVALRQLAKVQRGASPRPIDSPRWFDDEGSVGWVRISDVTACRGRPLAQTEQYVSDAGRARSRFVERGTLIMSICATIGLPTTTDMPCCIHDGFVSFTQLDRIITPFLRFSMETIAPALARAGQTGSQANLNTDIVGAAILPVPTIEEQRAIAAALRDLDGWIAAAEAEAEKLASVKAAAMHALLNPSTRPPGYKEAWVRARLGDRGAFSKGRGITRAQVHGSGLPAVRYGELYTRFNGHIRKFYSFIDEEVALTSLRLQSGDICFAASGETAEEIGKCAALLVDTEAYAGGDIIVYSTFSDNPTFLGYYLNSTEVAEQKARLGQGDSIVHIHAEKLADLEILLPSMDEQRAIAAVLTDIDTALTAAQAVATKAKAVNAAAMEALLSGRKRLPRRLWVAA